MLKEFLLGAAGVAVIGFLALNGRGCNEVGMVRRVHPNYNKNEVNSEIKQMFYDYPTGETFYRIGNYGRDYGHRKYAE